MILSEQIIQATVKQIKQPAKNIKAQTKIMAENCSVHEVDLLKTFRGIGDFSAIGLVLEIGSVERFSTSKKLSSFFGLHPVYKKSGDGIWGFRMSKKGRKVPRQILYMVTLAAINTNPLIREIYLRRTQQGMEKMAAIGLCMHKILRIIYGMLKHKKAFQHEIDLKNREKISQSEPMIRKDKTVVINRLIQRLRYRDGKVRKERNESSPKSTTMLSTGSTPPLR